MELYFLRHAIAVERGTPEYEDDSQRPLTPNGRKKMKRVVKGMKALGLSFDWIYSSPYLRAKATAELVSETFKLGRKLKFSEHLAADGNPKLFIEQMARTHGSTERLLVVGHEPYLSALAGILIGGVGLGLQLKKGGLGKLTTDKLKFGHCAELKWWLTPRLLARLADASIPRPRKVPRKTRKETNHEE